MRRGADDALDRASAQLQELNLGATAVGTGLNAGDDYTSLARFRPSSRLTALTLLPAANRFRVTQSMGDVLAYSGAMRRLAVELGKVASDLRLLSMGPRAGLAEIRLPAVQPGSSIMPGKVNPSIPEMVNQVCFQVIGCDATVCAAAEAGQLELNVMMPVIAWNALHASTILRNAMTVLRDALRAGDRGRRGALPRAARSEHRGRHRAQPVSRLRQDCGNRQGSRFGPGRPIRELVLEQGLMDPAVARPDAVARGDDAAGHRRRTDRNREDNHEARAAPASSCSAPASPSMARPCEPQTEPRHRGRCSRRRISGLLESPDRAAWQKPDLIMDALRIADGAPVADIGAGSGFFTVRLARRVGPQRPRLRRRHSAADARVDQAARHPRGA